MTPMEYRMSGVGSSVLSRCATAKTSRSPFRADSMARSVPGRPAAMGAVNPGNITVPRSGRTGSVWRVAMLFLEEVICGEPPVVAPSIPDGPESLLSRAAHWLTCAHSAGGVKVGAQYVLTKIGQSGSVRCHNHD